MRDLEQKNQLELMKKQKELNGILKNLKQEKYEVFHILSILKIGVLGKFALPTATAIYEKDGDIHEAESNKTFFMAEQLKKPIQEE